MTITTDPHRQLGVGIIGSGLVTRSIHLPALAALSDDFAVRAIWDVNFELAEATARTCGAQAAPTFEALLDDSDVDVVVIGSPAQFHAVQTIAALKAGKRMVLVEKPLCSTLEEADAIAHAARETGGMVVVGAMHLFDPAWRFMADQVKQQETMPSLVRSCIILPPNGRFDGWANEVILPPSASTPAPPPIQRTEAMVIHAAIMGLAIHDLPLVRRLLVDHSAPQVLHAVRLAPFGYMLTLRAGAQMVDMFAFMHGHWRPEWTLTATAQDWQAHAEFTPSFVMAGSGQASLTMADHVISQPAMAQNGYAGEWLAIAAMMRGKAPPPDPDDIVQDFTFALTIAEQASALIEKGAGQ